MCIVTAWVEHAGYETCIISTDINSSMYILKVFFLQNICMNHFQTLFFNVKIGLTVNCYLIIAFTYKLGLSIRFVGK